MQSVGQFISICGPKAKDMNDIKEVSEVLYDDEANVSISISSFITKDMMEDDDENINDELIPIAFVSVPPVCERIRDIDVHQDNMTYFDSHLKDPFAEFSDNCDVPEDRYVKEKENFLSEPQVKRKGNVDINNSESVMLPDKVKLSSQVLTNVEGNNVYVDSEPENEIHSNCDVLLGSEFSTPCSEGCIVERTDHLDIKLEPICQISEVDVKEENIFEASQDSSSSIHSERELPLLKQKSEFLNCRAQNMQITDFQRDACGEFAVASTSRICIPPHLEVESSGNDETHRSAFSQIKPCEEGNVMKNTAVEGPVSYSPHAAAINSTMYNHQYTTCSVQNDPCQISLLHLIGRNDLTGNVQTHSAESRYFSSNVSGESCNISRHFNTQMLTQAGNNQYRSEIYIPSLRPKSDLKVHVSTYTSEKLFKCEICETSFNKKGTLTVHMRTHTGEKRFQCEICETSFIHKISLTRHMVTHTGRKPNQCTICEKSYNDKGNLKIHMRSHTGEKPFQCEICKSSFSVKHSLKAHMRTHTGEKPFVCEICKSSFIGAGNLIKHMRTHTGEKPFQCEICATSFNEKSNLTKHIRTHTGEKPFQCEICKSSFIDKHTLQRHMRTHTGEKPFKCEICKLSFLDVGNLMKHVLIHTGEKPYLCEICQLSFNRNSNLKRHMRAHTGEKPFVCEICKSSFNHSGNLIVHMRIHTGEKPFVCEVCNLSFNRNGNLKRHMLAHTSEKFASKPL